MTLTESPPKSWPGLHRRVQEVYLLWMLTVATEQSLPLPAEVDAFADTTSEPRRGQCALLAEMLRNGTSLPKALAIIPGLVPKTTVTALHLGDQAGQIPRALRHEAVRLTSDLQRQTVLQVLAGALVYGWSLFLVGSMIVGFLMYWIVPKIGAIFEGFEVELPTITRWLIRGYEAAFQHFYLTFPLVLLALLLAMCVQNLANRGQVFGWDLRNFPLVGWLTRLETPLLLRSLSWIVASGQPLHVSLRVLEQQHHRASIRAKLGRVRHAIEVGTDCWGALLRQWFLLPAEVALLQTAERMGNLSWVLNELSEAIERRLQRRAFYITQLIEPVFTLLSGIIVCFICLGFFMPLIKLFNELS
jgi:type II secretory pathway component PulF